MSDTISFRERLIQRNRERSGYVPPLESLMFAPPEPPKRTVPSSSRHRAAKSPNTTAYHATCVVCSEPFTAKRPDARYCSDRCSYTAANERTRQRRQVNAAPKAPKPVKEKHGLREFTCEVCNATFQASMPWARYCSVTCRERVNNQRRAKKVFEPRSCAKCGNEYQPHAANAKYCSDQCRYKATSDAYWDKTRFVPEVRSCAWCNESFTATDARNVCCSEFCKGKAKRARRAQRKEADVMFGMTVPTAYETPEEAA